jgi:hypothetical protein
MENFLERLLEINKMYIVNVTSGNFLPTGSFIAKDADGKEYFANAAIEEIYHDLFISLSNEERSSWILVNDEVWGSNHGNREVSKINTISESEIECQQFKTNRLCKLLLNLKKREVFELHLDAVRNPRLIGNAENAVLYGNIVEILRQGIIDLNSITPYDI